MSMVIQLITAIRNAEHQLDDEISKLNNYQTKIDKVTQQVNEVLGGSSQQYVQRMTNQLASTKQQIQQTLQSLQIAKEKLEQVSVI